jgi:transcriptional regulator with XRE-family HTH domain
LVRLRLREWRHERGLSLRQLADRASVHWVTLYRIEKGKTSPTVAMLAKVAKPLRIAMRDFFPAEKSPRTRRRNR